jgi:hypothetical protein
MSGISVVDLDSLSTDTGPAFKSRIRIQDFDGEKLKKYS